MRREGRVAIIEIDNPPVNALSNDVRANLLRSVQEAVADRDVDAMVIAGAGRTFCAGAEIREFGTPPLSPLLPDLIDAIETVEKPVVAAVRGVAFGGGFEIALGAHARVAAPDARFALPEVKLGLIPGAGGTQRLPRLIGLVKSARLIASGDSVDAAEAKALGIVDAVIEGDLLAAAVARATEMATTKSPLRRLSREEIVLAADRADPAAFEAEAAAILKRARGLDAPAGVVEALRNALTLS